MADEYNFDSGNALRMSTKINKLLLDLARQKSFSLKAEGTSMLPILRPGDVLKMQKTSFSQVKTDDIVLLVKNGLPRIHRVIYKTRKNLVSKGDHRIRSDGFYKPQQVFSKLHGINRENQIFKLSDDFIDCI